MSRVLQPDEYAERFFRLGGKPFSLATFPYWRRIYRSTCREVNLFTARQVAKSTFASSRLVQYAATNPNSVSLYIAPQQDQAEVFSRQRLKDFMIDSPIIRELYFKGELHVDQVFRKVLTNGAMIALGYAKASADRLRGRSLVGKGAILFHDELQDMLPEVIQVIRQVAFRTEDPRYFFSGTPKSTSNHMEAYRKISTGSEWAVRCPHPGCDVRWNMEWDEKNIGNKGIICRHCGRPINTDTGQWVDARQLDPPGLDAVVTMESYRIPQLIVKPMMDSTSGWLDLLKAYRLSSTALFRNEVLGLPAESGIQPITLDQLKACCRSDMDEFAESQEPTWPHPRISGRMVIGVDWAFVGRRSFSYLVMGSWQPYPERFVVYYTYCFRGAEIDPEFQEEFIVRLAQKYDAMVCADYGCGQRQNIILKRALGTQRVLQVVHTPKTPGTSRKSRMSYDPHQDKWHMSKVGVLNDLFQQIRDGVLSFPRVSDCTELFAHICAEIQEYDERTATLQYTNLAPDDGLHALLYATLGGEYASLGAFNGHAGMRSEGGTRELDYIPNYGDDSAPFMGMPLLEGY